MNPRHHFTFSRMLAGLLVLLPVASLSQAQTSAFSYQGKLVDNSSPANGSYDFQFKLFDALTGGTQQGSTFTVNGVTVTGGIFTVNLDFGGNFPGTDRFLEISVKQTSGSTFTMLSPRQQVTSTPYAIRSLNTATADGLSVACVGCVTSSQIQSVQGSQIIGPISVANIPGGSGNYIQNTTSQQGSSNFSISGDGTAAGTLSGNIVNAATQYNIGNNRVMYVAGVQNTIVGVGAGAANAGGNNAFFGSFAGQFNTSGQFNSFFGSVAGERTNTGQHNAFFGSGAGFSNIAGSDNSFFGFAAGQSNTATGNSFFGSSAGLSNTIGAANSFFGTNAGLSNVSGQNNSFFGDSAGLSNTSGTSNAFFGKDAGRANTTALNNSFFGGFAGQANTSGSSNSFFGASAGITNTTGHDNAFFGFATGASNSSGSENSFFGGGAGQSNTTGMDNSFFGFLAGVNNTTGNGNAFFGKNAGDQNTTGNQNSFFGALAGQANTTGFNNSFFGNFAGQANTTGDANAFFGLQAGKSNTDGFSNSFFGTAAGSANTSSGNNSFFGAGAGSANTTGSNNTFVGLSAGSANIGGSNNTYLGFQAGGAAGLTNATAIGANASVVSSNSLVLGSINGINGATADAKIGIGTTAPTERLTVGTATGSYGFIHTDGTITVGSFVGGSTGGGWYGTKSNHSLSFFVNNGPPSMQVDTGGMVHIVTLGAAGSTQLCRNASNQISVCSSSLRYKTDLHPFAGGLNVVNRLYPITFKWKTDGTIDLGLGAEDVAEVEPLLVTHNRIGEIEGVKYDRLSAVFINAFKEQQAQIKEQQNEIVRQRRQLAAQQTEIHELKQLIYAGKLQGVVHRHAHK